MERKQPRLPEDFDDIAECYDYYLDLLGSIREAEDVFATKKERKAAYKDAHDFFVLSRRSLLSRGKVANAVGKTELKEFEEEFHQEYGIRTFKQRLKDAGRKMLSPGRKLLGLLKPGGKDKAKNPDAVLLEDKQSSPALENTQPKADVFIEVPDDEKPSEETENNENSQKTE